MTTPRRWVDDESALSDEERRLLIAGLRGPRVPPDAAGAVWESVTGVVAGGGMGRAASLAPSPLGAAALLKQFALGVALGSAVAGGAAIYEHAPHARSATKASHQSSPPSVTSSSVRAAPRPVAKGTTSASVAPAEASARPGSPVTARRSPAPLGSAGLPAPLRAAGSPGISAPGSGQASFETSSETASSESRRLVAARSLLHRGRPQAALEVLTSLAADFPSGALVQEREALTIEALLASGDRRSARRRALGFIARYPESPYAGDVREALK